MFWKNGFLSKRAIITIALFLIGSLHTMIFAIFQIPENFLMGRTSIWLAFNCKVVLYVCAIGIALSHQLLCRKFGLRKTLYMGLLFNLFGIGTLLLNRYISANDGFVSLIFLDMVFFGLALTSVINALVTYIIIEYPKKVGVGIVALFAFFNLGALFAPILMETLDFVGMKRYLYLILISLLSISIWFVHLYFFDPPDSPTHLKIKKGDGIWRELHYRLILFMFAIICYGLTETTFNLWGFTAIKDALGSKIADAATPFFWMFLIIGQIFLLVPLYFLPARRIFYFLIAIIMVSAFFFPMQEHIGGFIFWFALAGFGCSAVFPILLSQMEKEMLPFAKGNRIYFYIEKSVSLLLAGYFIGVGIIDLWVQLIGNTPYFSISTQFHLAIGFIGITGLLAIFLNMTRVKLKS